MSISHPYLDHPRLALPPDLTFEAWDEQLREACRHQDGINWRLGRLLLYGKPRYGDKYKAAVKATGLSYQTVADLKWVARRFEPSDQSEILKWTHHRALASLPKETRQPMMRQAEEEDWSVEETKEHVRAAKEVLSRPIVGIRDNDANYQNKDCLEFLPTLKDRTVDLIILDPPYYRVVKEEWDNQWKTIDEYYAWCERWIADLGRLAKYNCNLCLFGFSVQWRLMSMIEKRGFNFRQQIAIDKGLQSVAGRTSANLKMFPTTTEYAYLFHYDARDLIRDLLQVERRKLKMSPKDCNILLGKAYNGGGTFSSIASEEKAREHREYPTREVWETLRLAGMSLPAYDDLVFYFNLPLGLTDVWDDIDFYKEERFHPCQKPIPLMERLVLSCGYVGQTVLDPFAGSGTTAIVCKKLGLKFVGCEKDTAIYTQSLARIG